jgi:peptidoglycan-N-acetylglucosamine deacetylase
MSTGAIQDDLYQTDQVIYRAIGRYPTLFRPPYGATNTGMLSDIAMPFALWSIDTKDWKTRNTRKNIASIAHAKSGDIIIMHDIHEMSIASIDDMITSLQERGFVFVTVSEILELSPDNQQIGKRCYRKGDCR